MNIRMKPGLSVEPIKQRVRVMAAGATVADSLGAVRLLEQGHSPVVYIPIDDVMPGALDPTDQHTHCALKGEANYYSLRLADGRTISNAAWQYANPNEGAEALADKVSFYPQHIDRILIGE